MLGPALDDPDPVLIFEHGSLYNIEGELAADAGAVDIERAAIRRPGSDVTLVAYGGTLPTALAAADELAAAGIEAEVIDLRVCGPLDDATIIASVARTHRAVVVDEGWRSGSLAAEIERPHHRAGVLRSRRAGRAGVQRRGADALPEAPRGGRAPAARDGGRRSPRDGRSRR